MPVTSSFTIQLVLMVITPGSDMTPTTNGFRDTLWASSGGGSLLRYAVTPRKPGVSVAHWITSNSCVGEGVSCGMVIIFNNSVGGILTTSSSQLQNLSFGPLDGWGICLASTMGQDRCHTFSQPRDLGDLLSTAGSLAAPTVASSSGVPAGVVVLWVSASSVGIVDISSRGIMPLSTSSSEKER